MHKESQNVSVKEIVIVCILGMALLAIPCVVLGTITSGIHLVDDHELLMCVYNYRNGTTLKELIGSALKSDLEIRFRPLYVLVQMLLIPVFEDNLVGYGVLKAAEAVVAFVFMYLIARNLKPYKCEKIYAFIFALTVFLGYQSCIWWKLGTHEIQGELLFSIGFYLFLRYIETEKNKFIVLSLVAFEMMIFYKENLFLLLPFVGLYMLYLDIGSSKVSLKVLWISIKKRLVIYIVLLLQMAQVVVGYLNIGTPYNPNGTQEGTFGIGLNMFNSEVWEDAFHSDLKWFSGFGLLFMMILLTFFDELKKYWKELILGIVIILPQVIVFASTGMTERYIVPASIGFAYIFVYFPLTTGVLQKGRKKLYILGLVLLTLAHGRVMLREADYYRLRGNGVQATVDFVVDTSRMHPDVKILSTLEYAESNRTLEIYSIMRNVDNMYFYHTYHDDTNDPYIDRKYDGRDLLAEEDDFYSIDRLNEFDVIVMYSKEDRHYPAIPVINIDTSDFEAKRYGTLDVYVRNGSGINFPDSGIEPLKINF